MIQYKILNHSEPKQSKTQRLRVSIRHARQSLSPQEQLDAQSDVLNHFKCQTEIKQSQKIAIYLATNGELQTQEIIKWLWKSGKEVFLPVLHPFAKGHLIFIRYRPKTKLFANKYQILEPKIKVFDICPPNQLDLIVTPLVAFDEKGNRLGMGGGFYDRTFSNLNTNKIGLAHDCQKVIKLDTKPWDQALTKVITPSKVWQW